MADRRAAAIVLGILGIAQMGFDLADWTPGKAVAGATLLSPAPKVFSAVDGFETYSAWFAIGWEGWESRPEELMLDRSVYLGLRGPYNRRNVFGAAIAYGPVLRKDPIGSRMLDAVGDYAFLGDAPLLAELGIDRTRIAGTIFVVVIPDPWAQIDADPLDQFLYETFLERTP